MREVRVAPPDEPVGLEQLPQRGSVHMWAISTRRPNDQFVGLNRIFNDNFNPATVFNGWVPAVDVEEDEQGIRLSAEIPGYKPESVKVTLEEPGPHHER